MVKVVEYLINLSAEVDKSVKDLNELVNRVAVVEKVLDIGVINELYDIVLKLTRINDGIKRKIEEYNMLNEEVKIEK